MSNKILIETKIPKPDGSIVLQKFEIDFDYDKEKYVTLKYSPPADGGPLMRPSKPPR